jgi:2',3'-cyclic-nucleotide 2'-phosphodiesterase (5'-nucleotidase family)
MRFLIAISIFISACAATPESTVSNPSGLTFIHVNDTYRIADVEDGTSGGFGRVITVIRQVQSEGRDVHVLHGGDLLAPSLESQIWNGEQMVEALNFVDDIAPVYFVAGNHEFDFRDRDSAYFVNAVKSSRFDWLGDNYVLKTGDSAVDAKLLTAFTFTHGDKTIGVFAVTLSSEDAGLPARSYVEYDRDYMGNVERVIKEHEAKGVDVIIGITHLDMSNDEELARLRRDHPTFEFIAGGHEHEANSLPQSKDSAAIFKGSSNARVIWRIDVDFDDNGAASIAAIRLDMDSHVTKDPDYAKFENEWRQKVLELYPIIDAKVGVAGDRFNLTEESVRNGENGWTNYIVDQARGAFGEQQSDFAFINSGSIRIDDYISDDITYEDIARTFGFSSALRRMTLSGAEFVTLLEAGYRGEGRSKGYFPQISGFRVCVDRGRADYSRIVSLQVPGDSGWHEIVADQDYTLVIPDFLFGDMDGYTMPRSARESATPPGTVLQYLVLDAIIKSQAKGEKIGDKVDPANPRFVELVSTRGQCWTEG